MKEIIAIIRPDQAPATRMFLQESGIHNYATLRVLGRSRQGGLRFQRRWFRRSADIRFLPKRMFWIAVEDDRLSFVVNELIRINRTGRIGDGKLFVLPVEKAVPIEEPCLKGQGFFDAR